MTDPIRYRIDAADPDAHLFRVSVTVPRPDETGQLFRLPAWIPGSYLVRDFARNVVSAEASCDGMPVGLTQVDKSTWAADACEGPLTVTTEVYALDLSVRGAHLDRHHAYFNGPSVFLAVVGQEQSACELDIGEPEFAAASWRVATAMTPKGAARFGYGTYTAEDYWELIDHPVEIGDLVVGEFDVNGIPHTIAARGHPRIDIARLCRDLKTVCTEHHRLLGAPATLDRYLFLLTVVDQGYGGLEHRWSSSNLCSRDDLPARDDTKVSNGYRKLLGLFSHEYFHLWNITRMKPAAFTPYDLSAESYTGLLWVFEGITSYYDDLGLVRSGVITTESYLELLGQAITRVLRAPGRARHSIEASSFEAWTKFYRQDAGSPNFIVSYYVKGSLVALALDLTLRKMTEDRFNLDDVMRECWKRYGETGEGMPERGLESIAHDLCNVDLEGFFERYVRGTGDLPIDQLLLDAGVRMNLRPATGSSDLGGKPAGESARTLPWLGPKIVQTDGKPLFGTVPAGSPAEAAGLSPGDEAVALNGLKLTAGNLDTRLGEYRPGESVELAVFRRDELLRLEVELGEPPEDTCWLVVDDGAEEAAKRRRDAWLGL